MPKDKVPHKSKRRPPLQTYEGEWIRIAWKGQHEECCDCGMRHSINYKVDKKGRLYFKAKLLED